MFLPKSLFIVGALLDTGIVPLIQAYPSHARGCSGIVLRK